MSINVYWKDPQQSTLLYNLRGSWTWGDFETANLNAYEMIASVDHQVSVILDLENSLEIPTNALVPFRRMLAYAPTNLNLIVVSGADETEERMVRMLTQFDRQLGSRITLAHNMETAQRLITDFHHYSEADTNRSYLA